MVEPWRVLVLWLPRPEAQNTTRVERHQTERIGADPIQSTTSLCPDGTFRLPGKRPSPNRKSPMTQSHSGSGPFLRLWFFHFYWTASTEEQQKKKSEKLQIEKKRCCCGNVCVVAIATGRGRVIGCGEGARSERRDLQVTFSKVLLFHPGFPRKVQVLFCSSSHIYGF